ncbi:unnamed protein product [Microthlaspi erraticum]|uniref:Uncharacterized protein n=1 Tax=Microthlaspi erraticum TaxID=1685480 RepID=A0A6D2IT76_9BRAS|nr:unnamed protein product [Microthlaspi erraticum]
MVLQREIGLNWVSLTAPGIFGIREITVEFACRNKAGLTKKSLTALITSCPTRSQEVVKNSAVKPSGPGALFLGRAKTVFFISSSVGIKESLVDKVPLHRKG